MFHFTKVLSDFVKVGNVFIISGYSSKISNNIKILLSCGNFETANNALQLDSNFSENKITRSTFIDGEIGNEESSENLTTENGFPIKSGELFSFSIFIGDDRFHIAVNNIAYCTYTYKVSSELIRSLIIFGDIDLLLKVNHLKSFPCIYPNIRNDDELAFESFIPRQYEPGHLIIITGSANGKSDGEFVIMFIEDETKRQLIHFNVRFDEEAVVMNSMTNDER